jgi:hypothetical protein
MSVSPQSSWTYGSNREVDLGAVTYGKTIYQCFVRSAEYDSQHPNAYRLALDYIRKIWKKLSVLNMLIS